MVYILKKDVLEVKVKSVGAEIISVKKEGKEYMWQADTAFWGRTAPVLFPFVGGLKGKQYRYKGKTWSMGQHGFARDMEFRAVSESDTALEMELKESPETMENYPFRFCLRISYELKENHLRVGWKVENTNDDRMYFSIGAHPAFQCPFEKEEKQSDYTLLFRKDNRPLPEIVSAVIENGLVGEGVRKFELQEGLLPITPDLFSTDTLVLENGQVNEVSLLDARKKEYVRVSFDMPLVGIWTPIEKNAPFLCIEPWCGRCDDADFDGELSERKWGNKLEKGETFSASYEISVF